MTDATNKTLDVDAIQSLLRHAQVVADANRVQHALDELALQLNQDYAGRAPILLAVMNGGMYTVVELSKRLMFPVQWDYVHATRYGQHTQGGEITWKVTPESHVLTGRDVLVVDDILDEGETLQSIRTELLKHQPASLHSVVLTQKQHDRNIHNTQADYVGLSVPDVFLVGCGLDYQGYYRNLNALYAIEP